MDVSVDQNSPADFFVVGAQKAGTTALRAYLDRHPNIGLYESPEAHYFDDERHFAASVVTHDAYHARFPRKRPDLIRGEVTPVYLYWRDAPRRIWAYNSNARLIALLRNPIERAFSHWTMERSWRNDPLSFYDALTAERHRCRETLPYQHIHYSYMDRGFYSEQLRRLWSYFPREHVLVLKSDDLRREPRKTLMSVAHFLGVDPEVYANASPEDHHVGVYEAPIDPRALELLRETFQFEIRQLELMLGWDLAEWLAPG